MSAYHSFSLDCVYWLDCLPFFVISSATKCWALLSYVNCPNKCTSEHTSKTIPMAWNILTHTYLCMYVCMMDFPYWERLCGDSSYRIASVRFGTDSFRLRGTFSVSDTIVVVKLFGQFAVLIVDGFLMAVGKGERDLWNAFTAATN